MLLARAINLAPLTSLKINESVGMDLAHIAVFSAMIAVKIKLQI